MNKKKHNPPIQVAKPATGDYVDAQDFLPKKSPNEMSKNFTSVSIHNNMAGLTQVKIHTGKNDNKASGISLVFTGEAADTIPAHGGGMVSRTETTASSIAQSFKNLDGKQISAQVNSETNDNIVTSTIYFDRETIKPRELVTALRLNFGDHVEAKFDEPPLLEKSEIAELHEVLDDLKILRHQETLEA